MSESIGDVQAKLTLDSAQFDAANKKSQETATATGRAREAAAKKAAQAEALAAKLSGDAVSQQSLKIVAALKAQGAASMDYRKVQQLVRGGFIDNSQAAGVEAAALQRLTAAKLATAAATEVEAKASEHAITQTIAASAAVRSLEGNPGIRSIERFITTIPGMGTALQAIFPFIGAAGLAGLAFEAGEKLYEMGSKARQAAELTRQAFADRHDQSQISIDDLTLQNDKIQDQIDKLSGHPNNGLRTSLDEARKMADQLLVSLEADSKEMDRLLKENSVSYFASVLSGVAATGAQEKDIVRDQAAAADAMRDANTQWNNAIADAGGDPNKIAAANAARNAAITKILVDPITRGKQQIAALAKEQKDSEDAAQIDMQGPGGGEASINTVDNSAKIAQWNGVIAGLESRLSQERLTQSIYAGDQKLGALHQSKDVDADARKASEQARKASEQARKAAEAKLKGMEAELHAEQLQRQVTIKEEFDFWDARRNAFKAGSDQYNAVVAKQAELAERGAKEASEAIKRQRETALRLSSEMAPREYEGGMGNAERRAQAEAFIAGNQLSIDQQRNLLKEREVELNEASGKSMTRYAAAIALANAHAEEFRATQASLQAIYDIRAAAPMTPENEKALEAAAKALADAQAGYRRTSRADDMATSGPDSSAWVGAKDAIDEFTDSARDAAKILQSLVMQSLNSVNSTLLRDITGQRKRGEWTKTAKDLTTDVAGSALKYGEGQLLGLLGFGKKGGPQHVIVDNLPSLTGSTSLPGMPSPSSPAGSIVANILPFIPGFADGGDTPTGSPYIVGENGPELRVSKSPGSIVPNGSWQKMMGGGGDTHHYHIDARGSTDPAATAALVRQGIMAAAPQIAKQTIKHYQDANARRAPTSRR